MQPAGFLGSAEAEGYKRVGRLCEDEVLWMGCFLHAFMDGFSPNTAIYQLSVTVQHSLGWISISNKPFPPGCTVTVMLIKVSLSWVTGDYLLIPRLSNKSISPDFLFEIGRASCRERV